MDHPADIVKNLESQLQWTSTKAEMAIQSEKMWSMDSQSLLLSEIMHLKGKILEGNAAISTKRDDVMQSTLLFKFSNEAIRAKQPGATSAGSSTLCQAIIFDDENQ
jgi:hypothetical protein